MWVMPKGVPSDSLGSNHLSFAACTPEVITLGLMIDSEKRYNPASNAAQAWVTKEPSLPFINIHDSSIKIFRKPFFTT